MTEDSFNKANKKLWIFAGEASGDAYGAMLARACWAKDASIEISGMGASEMSDAGVEIMVDSTELGVVGLIEVLKHYPMFKRIFNDLVERADKERPDLVILIDYPGFNLRFAKKMDELGIKVVYYISPQVWAWGKRRIPEIARLVSHMMVIFPFEKDIYKDYGLKTTFVGHPMLELLADDNKPERDDNLIAILPGSRFSEVKRLLIPLFKTISELSKKYPEKSFVIPCPRETIAEYIRNEKSAFFGDDVKLDIVVGETNEYLSKAAAGIAASGTVTVQAAILGLPLVVVYKINPVTYQLCRFLVDIPYFTMVNLVAEKEVYEEYLQSDVNASVLVPALERIMPGGNRREEVLSGINLAIERLGGKQKASELAAEVILSEL